MKRNLVKNEIKSSKVLDGEVGKSINGREKKTNERAVTSLNYCFIVKHVPYIL